ncbi:putative Sulfatase N-terminal domain-containing protein [Seiridium cardinale]|uniref:Sulfatase N-terminal domain-containing protein n=1 Tax=Seiridium cardinale TaxID=138064 RepID=A0ABR2X7A9_9PEZI
MSWGLEILGNLSISLIGLANNVSLHGYEGLFTPMPLSSWRVTPDNPIRYRNSLDVERCAALHNELLWHGWNASGGKAEDFPGVNWFGFHRNAAQDARARLSSPLAAFLDQALTINGTQHSFFYHVEDLKWPALLWENHEEFQNPAERDRFLTLYVGHTLASHPDGLVYDQVNHKAIMQTSIFDAEVTQNGRQTWLSLEEILTAWLDMIDAGKVQAVTEDVHPTNEKFDPWILLPYSTKQLNDTVTAFNRLADAIESRMPDLQDGSVSQRQVAAGDLDRFLLSHDDLAAADIPGGFAHSFLTKARRPKFRYIAPGLSLPTPDSIKSQPFSSVKGHNVPTTDWDDDPGFPERIYPILIFSSTKKYETWRDPIPNPDFVANHPPFHWPYSQLDSFSAGLYFSSISRGYSYEFEDAVKLILPYPIGGFGYARTADGARFGENKAEKGLEGFVVGGGTFSDLFQLGYIPFGEMHDVQLEKVLNAWRELVESGEWTIGKDGVEESIQKWRDADTARKWSKYTLPMGW